MSEAYKQKEYELRSAIDNISSIPYVFENYVEETEYFIDRLLDDTKEINTLRNKLQQKENIIKEVREYIKNLTNFQIGYGLNENDIKRTMYASENNFVKDILEILDKGE